MGNVSAVSLLIFLLEAKYSSFWKQMDRAFQPLARRLKRVGHRNDGKYLIIVGSTRQVSVRLISYTYWHFIVSHD